MVLCEHFIFTSADLEEKSGYQVVSKSSGITSELLDTLEDYMYPIGMDPSKFLESKSMLILKGKMVFTRAKNIGVGFDGRPDTVYSHTIIMNTEDFKKCQNDSRIFNDSYIKKSTQEHLTPLPIELKIFEPDFRCIDVLGIAQVNDFIRTIFSKEKIAILNLEDKSLLQSLISLLPPSFRKISFSTLVIEPQRQFDFNLIQTNSGKSSLENYFIIDPKERKLIPTSKNTLFEQCIGYLIDIIDSKRSDKLTEIYEIFENISLKNYKEKISFAVGISIFDSKQPSLLDQKTLCQLLVILDKTPMSFACKHFKKLNSFLPDNIIKKYTTKFETIQILSNYIQSELTSNTISDMFNDLSNRTSESRHSLFHQLVEERTNDFKIHGHKILIDFVDDYYNNDVIQSFVENNILHQCIFNALEDSTLDRNKQKILFAKLVEYSLCHNAELLEKLFTLRIFDLDSDYDMYDYRNIIEELFKATEFHKKLKPKLIFHVVKSIYTPIDAKFPRNKKSGIIDNKFYYMQDIFYMLLNTMKYLLLKRKHEIKILKSEIADLQTTLIYFLELNHLPERSFMSQFNIFNQIQSTLISKLFSSFTKRCRE